MQADSFVPTQWWQTGVIYQIYPRSFQDTGGDGIGDLPGITARLDYLLGLGVTALWISPFYPSPMADFGYDVADYTGVDPLFGTLDDFDRLLAAAHGKGLRVILDFVPNHTSDRHPWFLESRASRDSPVRQNSRRDWYLWHDPVPDPALGSGQEAGQDTRPVQQQFPNNWSSHLGGSFWTWDEATRQFYGHSFLKEQPDLNWRHPDVKGAVFAALRFWLDRGVDGFRMDVLWLLIKDAQFRNNPPNPDFHPGMQDVARTLPLYTADQPETHAIVAEMRALLDSYGPTLPDGPAGLTPRSALLSSAPPSSPTPSSPAPSDPSTPGLSFRSAAEESAFPAPTGDASQEPHPPSAAPVPPSHRVLIGEIYLPLPELIRYYGLPPVPGDPDAPASELLQLNGANLPFNFHLIQTSWTAPALAEIITTYEALLPPGAWPNYVLGNHDQPRLATRIGSPQARVAAMLLLTLRGTPTLYYGDELGMRDIPLAPDQVQDPAEKNEPGKGRGRDPERSPMLWVEAPNAGFTTPDATPWLPLERDWLTRNAAVQRKDKRSFLTLYRHLLHLRRQHDTLRAGALADVGAEGTLLRYRRVGLPHGDSTDFQVLLNLGSEPAQTSTAAGTVVLTTLLDGRGSSVEGPVTLEGGEGLLIALN